MTEVRKIQCPSCGSNSTYKLFDGSYKCNYCQGSFMLNEGPQQQPGQVPLNRPLGTVPAAGSKKMIIAALAAFMIFGMAMAGFLLTKATAPDRLPDISADATYKPPVIKRTMAFAGERGGVIWIITEKHLATDSLCYELMVVDPKRNALMGNELLVPPFTPNAGADFPKKLGNNFWLYGKLVYNLSEDNGLVAYDMYTGKTVLNPGILSGKFPELKPGILKTEHHSSEKIFKITTTNGDVLSFNPFSQSLILDDTPKTKKEEAITRELYLSDGLKHHLYLFTKRGDGFPIVFGNYVQEARLPGPNASGTNNVKDIFGNIHIEKVSEKNYFRAQLLLRDSEGNLLLLYTADLKENAPVILESVNREGNTNWSLQDTSFLSIGKAFASENLGCEYTFSDTLLIITLHNEESRYIAIDISTGKLLWSFDPTAYLAKHAS